MPDKKITGQEPELSGLREQTKSREGAVEYLNAQLEQARARAEHLSQYNQLLQDLLIAMLLDGPRDKFIRDDTLRDAVHWQLSIGYYDTQRKGYPIGVRPAPSTYRWFDHFAGGAADRLQEE